MERPKWELEIDWDREWKKQKKRGYMGERGRNISRERSSQTEFVIYIGFCGAEEQEESYHQWTGAHPPISCVVFSLCEVLSLLPPPLFLFYFTPLCLWAAFWITRISERETGRQREVWNTLLSLNQMERSTTLILNPNFVFTELNLTLYPHKGIECNNVVFLCSSHPFNIQAVIELLVIFKGGF